jgi:DNA-binding response OmpR family regulator
VHTILIVHPDRKTQRTVQRILGITGHRIEIADTLEQATRLMQQSPPLVIVVDGNIAMNAEGEAFLALARSAGAEACMTLLGETARTDYVPHILGLGAVTNLLVHPMPVLGEELTVTVQKLVRGDIFGVEKYLLWGTELHSQRITKGSQRARLVEQLADDVRARGQSARVASMARLVADELISNAVHNAPVDAEGHHMRRDIPRNQEVELDERQAVQLRWGCDARYLALEVNDQFGSLDRDTILRSLAKNTVTEQGGGAGMGISLSYRSCDHLVFNLSPGKRTEIIALIDVRYPPSERAPVSSYNVFVERPS